MAKALMLNRMPNYVIAFVTGRCNMQCSFCCYAARTTRESPEMTPQQWAHAVSGTDALLHLTITGGEPFLRQDLQEIILSMVDSCGVPRLSINTNGFYTDRIRSTVDSLMKKLRGIELCLSISLDGPETFHDKVRGCPGAFAAARKTIDEVGYIRNEYPNFSLRVSSLLQPNNEKILDDFLDNTDSWPVDFHEIILVRDVPEKVQQGLAETYARLTKRQLERASLRYSKSIDWRIGRVLREDILERIYDSKDPSPCLAGGRMVELLSDGTVRGCEVGKMWDYSIIGNVAASGMRLVDIVKSEKAAVFRKRASTCQCTFECASSCTTVFRPLRWARLI